MDLPKAEKVLVIERVIESLGLQAVRDSLVGTVEKRGISGGQRKRVNVGLEMVMEPSLLILDEPTSGLDSSSSQLLLKALRREALEGVNICMVVHQPSFALFKMFEDLVLLAKGGLTVYHGPVKKVEEYFAGLGINVPERVNPPDHFIDILEGLVKPSTSSGVSYSDLPIRWMLHKGYPVPPDMQENAAGLTMPSMGVNPVNGTNSDGAGTEDKSFAGELWQDVKCNVELHRDNIRHNFLKSNDLSNRRTPGVFLQYKYFLGRVAKQRLREARIQVIDYLILLLAGACLGSIAKVSDETFGALGYTYTIIAVSLLCKIAALRSFSLEKLQYWRESASGISSLAYFLSKDTIDLFNTIIKPVVYLSMFYFFNNPRSSFSDNYIVLICLVYCVTGIAYMLAIFLEPGPAQLCSVLLPVVLTLIATRTGESKILKNLANFCYPKWALEAFVIANAER
ncbi:ABC transporter G family member 28 [Vitis vinifera]|nr:ABC transporter G family member 28 [Vitis vinifera]